ncbi:hypothetical protein ACQ27_gp610 [Klebsiella phage K64-1]|nr:hypothetical protein ACQ27_gp610 [Klebsiella phage K64-1]
MNSIQDDIERRIYFIVVCYKRKYTTQYYNFWNARLNLEIKNILYYQRIL